MEQFFASLTFDRCISLLMAVISLVSVITSARAVKSAGKMQMVGTYFSKTAEACSDYLAAVSYFVRNPDDRQAIEGIMRSLCQLQLYAPDDLSQSAARLYDLTLDWGMSLQRGLRYPYDPELQKLQGDMHSLLKELASKAHLGSI